MARRKLKPEIFYEDRMFTEQINRKAFVFSRTRGDRLFGSFGERTSRESFSVALEIGYYAGMMDMYRFFLKQANDGLASGRYDGGQEEADPAE